MQITKLLKLIIVIICIKCTYSWSYNPYCWVAECCNQDTIPGNINKLRRALKERVYGQHLVNTVVDALAAHWSPYYKPQKALTLSFHGWPGSGKNYVSKFIADSLYKHGTKSKYVHHFIGRIHFPLEQHAHRYKEELHSWLKGNITKCPRQLFIFDEVDKMPASVLNGIKPIIDYRDVVDGVDYTSAIFIFLSNTGASLINEHYEELWNKGKKREELQLNDFENLISKGAFNEEGWLNKDGFFSNIARDIIYNKLHMGSVYHFITDMIHECGFHRSDTIKSNLIDHYIPFLPMEHKHVIECIKDEFRLRNVDNPSALHVNEVLDFVEWGPDHNQIFSKTGCKRISAKVAVLVAKHYSHFKSKNEL